MEGLWKFEVEGDSKAKLFKERISTVAEGQGVVGRGGGLVVVCCSNQKNYIWDIFSKNKTKVTGQDMSGVTACN